MKDRHIHILWTNADVITGQLMVMMYARNSMKNGWWDGVTVILWGATAKLAVESEVIQSEIKAAQDYGVEFVGCIACAEELDVVEGLQQLGIELTKWGPPLTELIQSGKPLLSI